MISFRFLKESSLIFILLVFMDDHGTVLIIILCCNRFWARNSILLYGRTDLIIILYVVLGPGRGMASFSMDGQSLYNNRKTTSSSDRTLINAFRNISQFATLLNSYLYLLNELYILNHHFEGLTS